MFITSCIKEDNIMPDSLSSWRKKEGEREREIETMIHL